MAIMAVRGVRGAVQAEANTARAILDATKKLLQAMVRENDIKTEDIVSIIFTVTSDLNADFPAHGARELGWLDVPLLCATEIPVPGSLDRVIRVLMLVNTSKTQQEIKHVYLGETARMREDLAKKK